MSSLKKYKKIKYLGKGSYGAAILVELRSNPAQKFVIKEIIIGHLKPAEQVSARQEAEVLNQMKHSNITMYVESFVESSKLYIVMEHADGGDISESIKRRKANGNLYPETEAMRIFVQICLAMKHVHEANILHRDLKSQNIFLTTKGVVKLGDFGIAKVLDASDDQARTQIGTPYYLSPEICESKPYGRQSDVWSLGVVLFELLALELPFQAQSLPGIYLSIYLFRNIYLTIYLFGNIYLYINRLHYQL
jgi:NIMA (never in mitosis gene a)-related kinase